jgi:hypothetical protein
MGTPRQWQLVLGIIASVTTFLMLQAEVQAMPWAMIVLGCINVALAALRPGKLARDE